MTAENRKPGLYQKYRLIVDDPIALYHALETEKLEFQRRGFHKVAVTSDPEVIRHVLVSDAKKYYKDPWARILLQPSLGKNTMFTSEGEFWRRQRRLLAPAFHQKRIEALAPLMAEEAGELSLRWRASDKTVDVQTEMAKATLKIITRAMFSTEKSEDEAKSLADAVRTLVQIRLQFRDVIGIPPWVPRLSHRHIRTARNIFDQAAGRIIEERRASGKNLPDLLGTLMSASDEESNERMSDEQLKDEVRSYFAAGYETTATALTWVFFALDRYPEVEEKLHAEVDSVLGDRSPALADLDQLPYTLKVIQETMRLYTVVPGIGRQAIVDDEFQGVRISKGSIIHINIWLAHRNPKFWDDPEKFDPERFSEERSAGRHRYTYLPFGTGPRICIGSRFALQEAHLILATITRDWRLRRLDGYSAKPIGNIVHHPEDGLPMALERRSRT